MDFNVKEMKDALIAWIRAWFEKNGKGCNAVIGIFGGKDSSVCAALCVEVLGKSRVIGVLMPNGTQSDIQTVVSWGSMIPEWRLQMMANLIFRKYLSEKDKVLALANSIMEAHIGDTEEAENTTALLEAKTGRAGTAPQEDGCLHRNAGGGRSQPGDVPKQAQ